VSRVRYEFVPWGYVLEPRAGVVAIDVGNKMVPGVIDHHQASCDYGCAASLLVRRPDLVLEHKRAHPTTRLTLVMHRHPDFDCVVSAMLAQALWFDGELPLEVEPLAEFARQVDSATVPRSMPLGDSLHTVYLALGEILAQQHRGDAGELFVAQVERGLKLVRYAVQKYRSARARGRARDFAYHAPHLFNGRHPFREEVAYLRADHERYEADLRRGEVNRVSVLHADEDRLVEVDSLRLTDPQSALFKYFARADVGNSPGGRGFPLTHVVFADVLEDGDRHVISTDPEARLSLRGLGKALEEEETAARLLSGHPRGGVPRWPDVDNGDPWYDGRGPLHRYTIVDSPRAGSVLDTLHVEAVLRRPTTDPDSWQQRGLRRAQWLCLGCGTPTDEEGECSLHGEDRLPTVVSSYEIQGQIGEGGMGRVYLVLDRVRARPAAMKVVRAEILANPAVAERFLKEIRLASAHVHANLIDTYDRGMDDRIGLWVVMEFLRGQDLRHVLRDWQESHPGRPFPPSATVGIFTQICRGLDALHRRGIVHCDLKPSNVFITRDDAGWPRVKLLDFGCADQLWMLAGQDERDVLVTGTIPYMAPEAFEGERRTGTDVYALGCMLLQALTGRVPHVKSGDDSEPVSALVERRRGGAPDLSGIAASANRRVANLVRDALVADPRRRIQDVQVFSRRLMRAYDRSADGWR